MPCPKRMAAALRETVTSEDGVKMYTWRAVRRQHLHKLRKQTRTIVFFMALMEIVRVGCVDMVYAGKHGTKAQGVEDYGIAYNIGYFISWLYMCLFAILYKPLFSWWIPDISSSSSSSDDATDPSTPTTPTKSETLINTLRSLNNLLLPLIIILSLAQHLYHVISTFIYVDTRPVDPSSTLSSQRPSLNTRKSWLIRLLLLSGVLVSMALGKGMFMVLEEYDLARVKTVEYLVIVLPIQVNLGVLLGSIVQFKFEQRRARKVRDVELVMGDEKERLLTQE